MSLSDGASLLTFLDAPVMVSDPEGRMIEFQMFTGEVDINWD